MRRFSFVAAVVLVVASSVAGCVQYLMGGQGGKAQIISITSGEIRAKYTIFSRSGLVVKKGLTPDSVPLARSIGPGKAAKYRIEIQHPETGKVYTATVSGKRTVGGRRKLEPSAVEAPF